ncbi:MAG: cyclic nucleotide-binding domain-containing protein [Pseudomonadales bacterium]
MSDSSAGDLLADTRKNIPRHLRKVLDPVHLAEGSVLGALSVASVEYLLAKGRIVELAAGEILFDINEPADSFYVVCDGEVDFFRRFEESLSYLRTLGFGAEVGFVAMIALQNRSGRVAAHSDCVLLEISTALFARMHEQHPTDFGVLLLNLTRDLARLVRKLDHDLLQYTAV